MIKQQLYFNIVLSVFGILLGLLFCISDPNILLKAIFTCIGVIIIICALSGLLTLNRQIDEKEKNTLLISSLILLLIGLVLFIYPHMVATIIAGVFLLFMPLYRIINSQNKKIAFKNELVKLVLGVVLIVCGIGSTIKIILYIIGGLLILLSLIYLILNIVVIVKNNKTIKKEKEENDVIDV